MLVTEDRMNEGDGILLSHPDLGLGHHIAGALGRLGRRTSGPQIHSSQNSFGAMFITPMELAWNSPMPEVEIARLSTWIHSCLEKNPLLHVIWVLPQSTPAEQIATLEKLTERSTFFFAPPVYGFRDAGLMQQALNALKHAPGDLSKSPPNSDTTTPLLFAGDLAALLVSAPGQKQLFGKKLRMPATTNTLVDWQRSFTKHFQPAISWMEKIASRLSGNNPWENVLGRMGFSVSPTVEGLESALDFFPSSLSPLDRTLKQAADQHHRHPELESHFPPGRAL